MENFTRELSCCFTGHRPAKLPWGYNENSEGCEKLKKQIAAEIEKMYLGKITTFYTGMAMGTDIWCAEAVLAAKIAHPEQCIRLIVVVPHIGQSDRWSYSWQQRYNNIIRLADDGITLQSHYTSGCMQTRNRYMVDRSAHMLAVYDGSAGGTQYTVDYARRNGLDITIINPHD